MFLSNSKGGNGFSSKSTRTPVQEGALEPGLHEKAVLGPNWLYLLSSSPLPPSGRWELQTSSSGALHILPSRDGQPGGSKTHWWDFVHSWIQPLQKCPYLWVLCAIQCVHEDPNFIPKSLKCAVQDFSPFLRIQPDMRQRNQRQHTRAQNRHYSTWHHWNQWPTPLTAGVSAFSITHSCPQKSSFSFLHHPKGAAVQGLPLPVGMQKGAASWLSSLCPDKAAPTDSQLGEKDCMQHSGTDITTSLNKLLICDSIFTPQICFQSLLCLSSRKPCYQQLSDIKTH